MDAKRENKKIGTGLAAKRVGVHRATLARAAAAGEVPPGVCHRVLGQFIWDIDALDEWIAASDVSMAVREPAPVRRGRKPIMESVVVRQVGK